MRQGVSTTRHCHGTIPLTQHNNFEFRYKVGMWDTRGVAWTMRKAAKRKQYILAMLTHLSGLLELYGIHLDPVQLVLEISRV